MVDTTSAALHQRPEALYGVHVDIPAYVDLFGVSDVVMLEPLPLEDSTGVCGLFSRSFRLLPPVGLDLRTRILALTS